MSEGRTITYNPGWVGLLGVIFVLCKIFEYGPIAQWSWWLVLLPFYVGILIILGVLAIGALGAGGVFGIAALYDKWERRKRRVAYEKAQVWKQLGGK